jgi:hypothetical protein
MAKKDKAVEEEIPIGEAPAVIQEAAAAPIKETFEQKQERLKREAYRKRAEQAIQEREAIMRRNGLLKPDESLEMDPDAAVKRWCC